MLSADGIVSKSACNLTWVVRRVRTTKNAVFLVRGALTHQQDGQITGTVYEAFNVCLFFDTRTPAMATTLHFLSSSTFAQNPSASLPYVQLGAYEDFLSSCAFEAMASTTLCTAKARSCAPRAC
jgi:hypothetical protein